MGLIQSVEGLKSTIEISLKKFCSGLQCQLLPKSFQPISPPYKFQICLTSPHSCIRYIYYLPYISEKME